MYAPYKYVLVDGVDAFGNDMTMNRKASVCDTTLLGTDFLGTFFWGIGFFGNYRFFYVFYMGIASGVGGELFFFSII